MEHAVRVVRDRGRYMQEAVPVGRGSMAAVVGLDGETVIEICNACLKYGLVSPANFNSPDQTVIAGETDAVDQASDLARKRGAKRVLPLPVSAPFHCELMAPAKDRLAADLARMRFSDLQFPLITNVDAQEVRAGAAAKDVSAPSGEPTKDGSASPDEQAGAGEHISRVGLGVTPVENVAVLIADLAAGGIKIRQPRRGAFARAKARKASQP